MGNREERASVSAGELEFWVWGFRGLRVLVSGAAALDPKPYFDFRSVGENPCLQQPANEGVITVCPACTGFWA